jgi:hypothetical protein
VAGKPSIGSDPATRQASATQVLVASMPHNLHKAFETSDATSRSPPRPGPFPDGLAIGGRPAQARVDGSKQVLTTKQGVPIADNQNSLKAGLRGPTLLEDFILCEKITHFERADRRPGPVRDPLLLGHRRRERLHLRTVLRDNVVSPAVTGRGFFPRIGIRLTSPTWPR